MSNAKYSIVVVEAHPVDDDAVDIVVSSNFLDERALIGARARIERIEEQFLADSPGVRTNPTFLESMHLPGRMGSSGHLVVKLRHPGANF